MVAAQNSRVNLSALDLVPIIQDRPVAQRVRGATAPAQRLEASGYARVWYAEHHNSESFASSATALLMGQTLAATSTIRVGSGSIMLPDHVPLTVAESFGTLESPYPGRVDLELGGAPGTDMRAALALRRGQGGHDTFRQDIHQLERYSGGQEGEPIRAAVARNNREPLRAPVDQVDLTPAETVFVEQHLVVSAVGTPRHVADQLEQVVELTRADELMLNSYAYDPEIRARSLELTAQAWDAP